MFQFKLIGWMSQITGSGVCVCLCEFNKENSAEKDETKPPKERGRIQARPQ